MSSHQPESRLKTSFDKAVERYSETSPLRAVVTSIPMVGGAIDTLLSGRGSKIVARRQTAMFEALREDMERLEKLADSQFDPSFFESDEFMHLVMKGLHYAGQVRREEQIKLLSRALAASFTKTWGADRVDESEALLDIVSSLSLLEAQTLFLVMQVHKDRPDVLRDNGKPDGVMSWAAALGPERLSSAPTPVLLRLQAKGLIRQLLYDANPGPELYETYEPTDLAFELFEFLGSGEK